MKKKLIIGLALLIVISITAYQSVFNSVATFHQSRKKPEWVETEPSVSANAYFWDQFHNGNYDSISGILEKLTAAYLNNPADIKTINHLAFTHMWAIAERQQNSRNAAQVVEHAFLAVKYFGESWMMNPDDTRMLSFLSSAKMVAGSISEDEKMIRDGYLNGLKSIREWEVFSAFGLAYTMSRLPVHDQKFQDALNRMRELAADAYCDGKDFTEAYELCKSIVSRKITDPRRLGKNRVVPNSWVAPHNIEGFFMALGDMLVKNGQVKEGKSAYQLAKYAPDYVNWDFKSVLENRITNAEKNVEQFRRPVENGEKLSSDQTILVQSPIACRSCHQMSKYERETVYADFEPEKYLDRKFYFLK